MVKFVICLLLGSIILGSIFADWMYAYLEKESKKELKTAARKYIDTAFDFYIGEATAKELLNAEQEYHELIDDFIWL